MFAEFTQIYKKNFLVNYKNNELRIPFYIENMLNDLAKGDKPSIMVYPGGEELNILLITYMALYGRYENFMHEGKDITDELDIDDRVYYENGLGKFKGKKKYCEWGINDKSLKNDIAVKIEKKDGNIFISSNKFFGITRYNGDATRLNNINKQHKDKKITELIREFNLHKESVSSMISSSILYIKNKNDLDNVVNNTFIAFGKVNNARLSEIVPIKYWSSYNTNKNYPGNRIGLKAVVNTTCSLENALELLYEREDIESVVIDLANFRGIDYNLIEKILDFKILKTKIVLLPIREYYLFNSYFKNMEFNIIHMMYDNLEIAKNNNDNSPIHQSQINILDNFKNQKIEFTKIDNHEHYNFGEISKSMKLIIDDGNDNQITRDILNKISHLLSLLKSYMWFDSNTKNCENKKYIYNVFEEVEGEVKSLLEEENFYNPNHLKFVLKDLKELMKKIIIGNRLATDIKEIIKYSKNNKILFIIQNNRVKGILDSYIRHCSKNKTIQCKTIFKISEKDLFDNIYVISFIPNSEKATSKLFSMFFSNNIEFKYYESYLNYIKYLSKKYFLQILNVKGKEKYLNKNNQRLNFDEELEDYNLIGNLIQISKTYDIDDILRVYFRKNNDKSDSCCEFFISFNGYYGVFNKDYKVYKVNVKQEQLEYIKVSELAIGDEIIILNDEFKSGSFIEELIKELLCDDDFRAMHGEKIDLSKKWKLVITDYMDYHEMTKKEIYTLLKGRGLKRTYNTFTNWIDNEYIVGPNKEDDYKIIYSLKDTDGWREVCYACKYVRKLHISLRADIGKLIVESYFDNKNVEGSLKYLDIDFMEKITICEVLNINKSKFKVASYMVNSIKRKED